MSWHSRACDWCGSPATWVIECWYYSLWACDEHDVAMARKAADSGVNIIEIAERR